VGAKSVRNSKSSRISAVASARSARTSQVSGFKGLISSKALKQKSLPLFLRDSRSSAPKSSAFRPPSHLVPIQEILGDPPSKNLHETLRDLRAALEHDVYADSDLLYRLEDLTLTASDLKKLLGHEDLPGSVIQTFFRILRRRKGNAYAASMNVIETLMRGEKPDIQIDLRTYEVVLLPLWTDHWSLCLLYPTRKAVELFEVLRWRKLSSAYQAAIVDLLRLILKDKGLTTADISWRQSGENTCGAEESGKSICEYASSLWTGAEVKGREGILELLVAECEADCS